LGGGEYAAHCPVMDSKKILILLAIFVSSTSKIYKIFQFSRILRLEFSKPSKSHTTAPKMRLQPQIIQLNTSISTIFKIYMPSRCLKIKEVKVTKRTEKKIHGCQLKNRFEFSFMLFSCFFYDESFLAVDI